MRDHRGCPQPTPADRLTAGHGRLPEPTGAIGEAIADRADAAARARVADGGRLRAGS